MLKLRGVIVAILIAGCGCIPPGDGNSAEATAVQTEIKQARVDVHPTKGNDVKGTVIFTKEADGIRIVADISGLIPGKHGFHVHEHGDCSAADASSAGGHFNPTKQKHGGPDSAERHVGDFGNLVAGPDGKAHYDRVDKLIAFSGTNSIIGKSIVIHAGEDDFVTQPTGDSGARIACGLIEAAK